MTKPIPKRDKDTDLEIAYKKLDAFAELKQAIVRTIKEHPDYVAESLCIDDKTPYIVLKRTENGIRYSIDLEIKLEDLDETS